MKMLDNNCLETDIGVSVKSHGKKIQKIHKRQPKL